MNTNNNKLWAVDEKLFAALEGQYQSNNEAVFFRNVKFKQEYELALSNDLLLSELENDDHVYLVRVEYDEYIVGVGLDDTHEIHVMNLSEALAVDLATLGLNRHVTLLEWLRARDYEGVKYDHNYDRM